MRYALSLFSLVLFFSSVSIPAAAQKVIEGTVRDADTGETLPSANIIIENAYRGTITNRDGGYSLTIPDSLLPVSVQVRYIGYSSVKREITKGSARQQDFELTPSVGQLGEIVVTDEDPGVRIMREVIERKKQWRSELQTYRAEAYTRQNLSSDTSLVMITESASSVFWDKEKGPREVLKWRRQTANIDASENFAGVSYLPNFYDDNVEIAGFDVVGVTHPDALSYYDFKLKDRLTMDGRAVYRIEVIPERDLQPLFKGEVFVLDEAYALLEVELTPNSVVRFPPPVRDFNLAYSQQFSNYGGNFWLPVDARIDGTVKISMMGLRFPRMHIRQLAKISSYNVNVALPDSLYEQDDLFTVDTTATESDSIAQVLSVEPVPLSKEEERAYATLDSTQTLEEAFKPSGFLARFVDMDDGEGDDNDAGADTTSGGALTNFDIPGQLGPRLRYNRVDELYAGLNYEISLFDGSELSLDGGYSTGYGEWGYGAGLNQQLGEGRWRPEVGVAYHARTVPRYRSQTISPTITSVSNVLGYENYFDYFRDEGVRFTAGVEDRRTDLSVKVDFKSSEQRVLETETGYDLLGQDRTPRLNPAIDEGRMHTLGLQFGYNLDEGYSFGVVGRNRIALEVETSDESLGSDFNFTRYTGHLDWTFDTFYQRRVFPNTLSISLDGGTYSGELPLQKLGIVDVAPGVFTPFEGLRTVRFQPYEGEQFAAVNAEHNFRTVPFERLGLTWLVERNIGVLAFAGAARTWMRDERRQQIFDRTGYAVNTTKGTHLEAGLSLSGILDLFRVDFAARIDEPAFMIGIGFTRFN